MIFLVVLFLSYILHNTYWNLCHLWRIRTGIALGKPSIFRLLDLAGTQPRTSALGRQPSFPANLHAISENLKQVIWYQSRIQNPVKYLKAIGCFYKTSHLRCSTALWIWFLSWNKNFVVLNSIINPAPPPKNKKNIFGHKYKTVSWIWHARSDFLKIRDCEEFMLMR